MATLYLVSTPIGNLGDISRRAVDTLASVDRVLAEDTRRTRGLLTHLGLSSPLVSLHSHNETSRTEQVLAWLEDGEGLALVADAGTPLISDPGTRLVRAVLGAGHRVIAIPGPSAVMTALVSSGLPTDRFTYQGFPPRKGPSRAEFLERVTSARETTVLFESPERLVALLEELRNRCGSGREIVVARELTKLHEEMVRGTLEEVLEHFHAHSPRGEITIVLDGAPEFDSERAIDDEAARALALPLLSRGTPASQVAREVSARLKIPRNRAYRIVQHLADDSERTS